MERGAAIAANVHPIRVKEQLFLIAGCRDLLSNCFEKYGKLTEGALNLKYDTISSMDPSKLEGTFSDFHSAPASTVWRPNQI